MNAFGYRPDTKITDVLRRGKFTLSAEIIPPRNGAELDQVMGQIRELVGTGAEFLSVTKGAGGSLRGGSLPIAQAIKEQFNVPCIAHFTCRDLTLQDVENQLIDHHYFGIRNILALRGDPPTDQLDWKPKPDAHHFAFQLIEQIRKMNEGKFLSRPSDTANGQSGSALPVGADFDSPVRTDFSIGAAVYPEHVDEKERYEFFRRKCEEGAEYAITQMVFDVDAYARFLDGCAKRGMNAPILPGTRILKSRTQALKMAERFQVSVPKSLLDALPERADTGDAASNRERSLIAFQKLVSDLRRAGAPGIHLFVLSDTRGSCDLIQRLQANANLV